MKGKALFVIGAGVGYVLGARAGRERYDQITDAGQRVWRHPKVQEGSEQAKELVDRKVSKIKDSDPLGRNGDSEEIRTAPEPVTLP